MPKGASLGPSSPPDRVEPGRRACADSRGAARRRLAAATVGGARRRDAGRRRARRRRRSSCLSERYREGRSGIVLEHVAGGWAFRAVARGGRGLRAAVRTAGRAGALPGGARDAGDRGLPRPLLAARDRADPRRQRRRRRRRAARARADRRGRPRERVRRDPLPDDAAVRARLRARSRWRSCRGSTISAPT